MLITDATLPDGRTRDVRIEGETIAEIGELLSTTAEERSIDASGKRLMPGMIDVHVHFRQPGYSHKETWASGSKSAAAGGVTTVVDQPNTDPPTIDGERFDHKSELAADSLVDFGINGGVTDEWQPEELFARPLFALGEVFLADSTGNMGIDADLFADAVSRASERDVTVTVHAEDARRFNESARERDDADAWSAYRTPQAEIDAVRRACTVANDHDARIHVAHTSTPEAIDIAADAGMTCEVTPHHLFLSRNDLPELGTFGRMNPPLRRENRRRKVFERVADGTVDMIATDHAPHTREEKDASIWEAPSGVPGVETALPLLLNEAREGNLSYERIRDLTAANPAAVFGLSNKGRIEAGFDADLVLVDPDDPRPIRGEETHTNCDWTPFEGMDAVFPELTTVRGTVVYENRHEELFGEPVGENVRSA
ncbi:dihydroorotase [Halapricum hydrolyticum]|uniref:Dihydroorotase n=1 Tax=Halapricum hydrolyticum TaxID=2979991 RepID=A0AAE3IA22_9EURY|nr:dihydroorotase [Halapricum hydrolyticum]MCU4718202.1 dihydroorotase [Halapricum hydrolyticum]MCU4726357.1 dihydroorotase [Halapricum hydrolyticum]